MPRPERLSSPAEEPKPKRAPGRLTKRAEQAKPSFDEQLEAVGFDEELGKLETQERSATPGRIPRRAGPDDETIAALSRELVSKGRAEKQKEGRAEYVPPAELKNVPHPKQRREERVVIKEQEEEASRNVEHLRRQIEQGSSGKSTERAFEDLAARTRQQISLADSLRMEFMEKAGAGGMSDADMNRYDNRLMQFRNQLEGLQAETRTIATPADRTQLEALRNQLFESIKHVEEALRVAELTPSEAKYESTHRGVREHEMETEEKGAKARNIAEQLAEEIKAKYGAEPEELLAGGGMKGAWFRMKNALSHIAGRESEYDKWRKATSEAEAGEMAHLHRTAHERKQEGAGTREQREAKKQAMEADREERKRVKAEAQAAEREWVSKTLGRERAMSLYSDIEARMQLMKSENPDGYAFTAEGYVTNLAHLSEAMQGSNKREIKEYARTLQDWNKELGYPLEYNPLLGSGASRLTEARALGGRGRARAEQAEAVGAATGTARSGRETARRTKAKEEMEIVTPEEHAATTRAFTAERMERETAPYEAYLETLRSNPVETTKAIPNAAQLWDHLTHKMNLESVSNRALKTGKPVRIKSFANAGQDATEMILNLAAFKKATEDGNMIAAQKYQDAVATMAHNYLLQYDPELMKAYNLEFPEPETVAPKGSRTITTKPSLESRARAEQRVRKQNQRSRF